MTDAAIQEPIAPGVIRTPPIWGFGKILCRVATTLMFDLKTYGRMNVPHDGGALLISNHQSFLDPILLAVHLPRSISYVARSTLFDKPAFGWLIRQLNAFPIRRGEADVSAIKESIRRLQEGHVLTMFPEGTRSKDGNLGPILPGIAMIVKRANVPVIPAVIHGSFEAWPKGVKLPRPHPIRVLYGPPLQINKLKATQIVDLIDHTLRTMLDELKTKP